MRREGPGFGVEPLTDMVAVGAVTSRAARIWIRSDRPGQLHVRWWPDERSGDDARTCVEVPSANDRDNTCVVKLPPEDIDDMQPLEPVTEYRFRVTHADADYTVGEGRFETFPDNPSQMPSRFSVGFMSCHQPFDKDGRLRPSAPQMLRAAKTCLDAHDTKFVLQLGDQMYSDYPARRSLLDANYLPTVAAEGQQHLDECSAAEVRRLYHQRYRYFWNLEDWKAIQADYPCYPILDDHDVLDNWGSDPNHQRPRWQSVGRGARQAYFDYQGSRVSDPENGISGSFHYSFTYGALSTFVMDLRSERRAGDKGQLFSKSQEADFERFLDTNSDQPVLLIVLSVPVVHLPRLLARIVAQMPPSDEDFSDRWSSGNQIYDRDRFLHTIRRHQLKHPSQRIMLISGDIHVGCAHKILWDGGGPPLYQFVSSGITHETDPVFEYSARFLMWLKRSIATTDGALRGEVLRLPGDDGPAQNPYGKLNFGVLDFDFSGDDPFPQIRFHIYGHAGQRPKCVYRSPVI